MAEQEAENDMGDTTATLLPLSKIKKIMRSDPDVRTISQEAVLLVTKATVFPVFRLIFFLKKKKKNVFTIALTGNVH